MYICIHTYIFFYIDTISFPCSFSNLNIEICECGRKFMAITKKKNQYVRNDPSLQKYLEQLVWRWRFLTCSLFRNFSSFSIESVNRTIVGVQPERMFE